MLEVVAVEHRNCRQKRAFLDPRRESVDRLDLVVLATENRIPGEKSIRLCHSQAGQGLEWRRDPIGVPT